jgi:DUF1009 family protein
MSATEEKRIATLSSPIKKLGIIAGGGAIPPELARAAIAQGIEPFIVAFDGQTDKASVAGFDHMWSRLGATGSVMKALKIRNISDIVIIGAMRRPALAELRPDRKTFEFFTRYALKALGDDSFLKSLRLFLEKEGFQLHGAHAFLPQLLAPKGLISATAPSVNDQEDIERGRLVLSSLAVLDIGQAVIVQKGIVLGVEAVEGTARLIERCKDLKRAGGGGVLVKCAKKDQDPDLDLPTIGPATIESLHKAGLAGVAVESGASMIVDYEKVCRISNRYGIFVIGV